MVNWCAHQSIKSLTSTILVVKSSRFRSGTGGDQSYNNNPISCLQKLRNTLMKITSKPE